MLLSVLLSLYLALVGSPLQPMDAGGTPFAVTATTTTVSPTGDAGGTPFAATTTTTSGTTSGDAGGTPFGK